MAAWPDTRALLGIARAKDNSMAGSRNSSAGGHQLQRPAPPSCNLAGFRLGAAVHTSADGPLFDHVADSRRRPKRDAAVVATLVQRRQNGVSVCCHAAGVQMNP